MSRHSLFISLFSSSRFLSMAASGSSPILRRAQVQRPPLLFFASNPESLLWPPPASSSSWPHSWSSPLPPKSPTGEVVASSSLATRARLGLLVAIVEGVRLCLRRRRRPRWRRPRHPPRCGVHSIRKDSSAARVHRQRRARDADGHPPPRPRVQSNKPTPPGPWLGRDHQMIR